tara:strand:+ start:117 stop:410 length:294 start_codon:yes stop_codon:yes gene_type:complete
VNNINKDTYTRSDLESTIRKEFPSLNKSDITKSIDTILELILESVALDNKVEIRGFGTFSKKVIRPRKFINPKTKKISYLGETTTLHFKPSKFLINK